MTYLVKDLLISILPSGKNLKTAERLPWWCVGCSGGATGHHLMAVLGRWPILGSLDVSSASDPASMALLLSNLKWQLKIALDEIEREDADAKFGPRAAQEIEELQSQLKKALAEIDREERTIDKSLKPHTLEQVEDLEAKLEQAQAELKQLRLRLEKP